MVHRTFSLTALLLNRILSKTSLLLTLMTISLFLVTGCAWLDTKQRQIIYRATPGMPADFAGLRPGDERFFIEVPQTGGQRMEMWWLPQSDKNAPTLLYLHGTFRTLFDNLHKIESLHAAGYAVLAVDYRGWGMSTPITPSEQTILQDTDAAWMELKRREPRATQRVIYGHSMGTGAAVDLASHLQANTDYGGLILESAFTSFSELAAESGFIARLIAALSNERFASIDKINRVNAPLLMLHGRLDTTIPMHLGEKLFAAANPPKQWQVIEGGAHSDLDLVDPTQYQDVLKEFKKTYLSSVQLAK